MRVRGADGYYGIPRESTQGAGRGQGLARRASRGPRRRVPRLRGGSHRVDRPVPGDVRHGASRGPPRSGPPVPLRHLLSLRGSGGYRYRGLPREARLAGLAGTAEALQPDTPGTHAGTRRTPNRPVQDRRAADQMGRSPSISPRIRPPLPPGLQSLPLRHSAPPEDGAGAPPAPARGVRGPW